ncbi:hypothetical protein Trydic_g23724 [Trypoxylus dichotomus]
MNSKSNEYEMKRSYTTVDGNVASQILKSLDANSYATKKTIAQGLLDVALLTANASQLKYILQVGESHDFYSLMLGLIITSIVLQLIQLLVCIVLGSKFNINKEDHQDTANIANNIILGLNALIVGVNIFISSFEMRENFADNNDNTKSFFNVSTTTETFLKTT